MEDISIKRTVIPHFNFRDQTLKFEESTNDYSDYMRNGIRQEIDFKNQTTQKALMALGWTPPPTNHITTTNGFEEDYNRDKKIERCAMAIVNSVNEKVGTHSLVRQDTNDENFDITTLEIKELIKTL